MAERSEKLKRTLSILTTTGIALGIVSALLVCMLIAYVFAGYFFGFGTRDVTAALFMAAMFSLIGGLVSFLREISIAVRHLRTGRG